MDASVYAEVDDDLKKSRLPHALSNCVYEIAFLDRMPAVAPDLGAPVCVYGADSGSFESRMAAEKLCRHGYTQVYEFSIDMQPITCLDLAGNPLHDVLVRHLRDHDFFDTALYPEATFVITRATPLAAATPGSPNLTITASLTLKGISHTLEFPACAGVTADGKLAAQATMAFDRTLWNVLYGSGKWFRHLGGHLVNDLIELQLRIVSA